MMGKLWTKAGVVLVGGFLLGSGLILAAGPVQAHTLTDPSCSGLPTADNFYTSAETAALTSAAPEDASVSTKKGTGQTGGGSGNYYYAKITVPVLTAGELDVSDAGSGPSEAILCGRQEGNVSSLPSYASAHNAADAAAARASSAATAAGETGASLSTARAALRSAATALTTVARALTAADNDTLAGTTNSAADTARMTADDSNSIIGTVASGLTTAASELTTAANALSTHAGFDINALISSGDEEYVVVVSVLADATAPTVSVTFEGVISTVANAADEDEFTLDNELITRTLATTTGTPGLLTVRTTGNAADTKGTLDTDATPGNGTGDIAMDEGSGGNFEIVSPVGAGVTYQIHVEGQTPGERGEFGLKVEFGVASALTIGTTPTGTALKPGRADYFFFTVGTGEYSFLTVRTEMPTGAAKETDTTGTFFSRQGLVVTDTNSGPGNNFLFRVPTSPGDYIVEVKGASSSTEGAYNLVTTPQEVDSTRQHGRAPDMITGTASGAIPARGVVPHSITVTTPGTLQVKTTGDTNTVGVLYGPDGQQITTDDNSGKDMNFKITQAVGAGQHIVTVGGRTASDTGGYTLVVNFVEGATIDGGPVTTPGTGDDDVASLQALVTQLRNDLNECRDPVVTDARGNLENPPDGGYRSGIGVISGWVCDAEDIEVRIVTDRGIDRATLQVAYGTSRPDTVGQCDGHSSPNTGFGMTYNFNHLPEGEYTITAYADGDTQIGEPRTFEVVHIQEFAADDENRFLRLDEDVQDRGVCIVDDFPVTGEGTWLKWEQSTQNFVIEDQG